VLTYNILYYASSLYFSSYPRRAGYKHSETAFTGILSRRNARIVQIHSLQAGLRQFYQCRTLGGLLKEIQHKICSSERADQSALARITGLPKYGEWRIRVVETPRS